MRRKREGPQGDKCGDADKAGDEQNRQGPSFAV